MIVTQVNGTTVRKLRDKQKISQIQLACDIELSEKVIKLIENNRNPGVRLDTVVRLARYFNVSIEYLLEN